MWWGYAWDLFWCCLRVVLSSGRWAIATWGVYKAASTMRQHPPQFHGTFRWLPANFYLIATYAVLYGSAIGMATPLFYELAAELAYPVPEGTSGAFYTTLNNIGKGVTRAVLTR